MKAPILISQAILLLATFGTTAAFSKTEIIQRRLVLPEHIDEFIERETTYSSEVALKAITDGKMEDWSLCNEWMGSTWTRVTTLSLSTRFLNPLT